MRRWPPAVTRISGICPSMRQGRNRPLRRNSTFDLGPSTFDRLDLLKHRELSTPRRPPRAPGMSHPSHTVAPVHLLRGPLIRIG